MSAARRTAPDGVVFSTDAAVLMFVTLFGLYSPLAALPSYMPIVGSYTSAEQRKLAFGLLA